jgi:hypothetical protein
MAQQLPPTPLGEAAAMPPAKPLAETGFETVIAGGLDAVSRVKSFLGI